MSRKIDVGCAVIRRNGKILIAQRKPDDHLGLFWEFPGGKVESDETLEACLVREIQEELAVEVKPVELIRTTKHVYPERTILLHFYLCEWVSGEAQKIECHDFSWIPPDELISYKFPPADDDIIKELIEKKNKYFES